MYSLWPLAFTYSSCLCTDLPTNGRWTGWNAWDTYLKKSNGFGPLSRVFLVLSCFNWVWISGSEFSTIDKYSKSPFFTSKYRIWFHLGWLDCCVWVVEMEVGRELIWLWAGRWPHSCNRVHRGRTCSLQKCPTGRGRGHLNFELIAFTEMKATQVHSVFSPAGFGPVNIECGWGRGVGQQQKSAHSNKRNANKQMQNRKMEETAKPRLRKGQKYKYTFCDYLLFNHFII